jgi:hypothetical protein
MPSAGFETAVPAIKPLQTATSDRAATGTDAKFIFRNNQHETMVE